LRNKYSRTEKRLTARSAAYGTSALLAVAGLTAVTPAAAGPSTDLSATAVGGSARAGVHVTLVTGDTVSMDGTGRVTGVRRGKGRGHIGLSIRRFAGHTYVVPQDATRLLDSGRLDRRLFDITQLVKDGYDDTHRKQVSLIVSYQGGSGTQAVARGALAAADAEVERVLPAVHGVALAADKLSAGPTRYRLSISTDRGKDYRTSDHVDAVWTFTSRDNGDTKGVPFPLSVVRFQPKLSLTDTAKAGARVTVPLSLQGPAAAKGHLKSLTVRVSYDSGRTWKTAAVHTDHAGKRYLTLTHPKKPGTVSFRASLTDTDGNTSTQTIRTAYRTVR
jgi:hypothetical protein